MYWFWCTHLHSYSDSLWFLHTLFSYSDSLWFLHTLSSSWDSLWFLHTLSSSSDSLWFCCASWLISWVLCVWRANCLAFALNCSRSCSMSSLWVFITSSHSTECFDNWFFSHMFSLFNFYAKKVMLTLGKNHKLRYMWIKHCAIKIPKGWLSYW